MSDQFKGIAMQFIEIVSFVRMSTNLRLYRMLLADGRFLFGFNDIHPQSEQCGQGFDVSILCLPPW